MAKKKGKGGRPTVITPEVTAKLVEAYKDDFTQREACLYAGISEDTFQRRYASDERFAVEMDGAKAFVFFAAKRNIAQAVVNQKDIEQSKWYLQKRQKDLYSDRIEQTGRDGEKLIDLSQLPEDEDLLNLLKKKKTK